MSFVTNKLNGFYLAYNGTPNTGDTFVFDGTQYVPSSVYIGGYQVTTASSPNNGDSIVFNGSEWGFGAPSVSGSFAENVDLSGSFSNPTVVKLRGRTIDPSAPTDGYVLTWDNVNSYWTPLPASGGVTYDAYANQGSASTARPFISSGPGNRQWLYVNNTWRPVLAMGLGRKVPVAAGWTWVNQGSTSTVSDDDGEGGLSLFFKSANGANNRYIQRTLQGNAASAYVQGSVTIMPSGGGLGAGIGIAHAASGQFATVYLSAFNRTFPSYLTAQYGTSTTSTAVDYNPPGGVAKFRVRISGSNVLFEATGDGVNWHTFQTTAKATIFGANTPDMATIHGLTFYSSGDFNASMYDWEQGDSGGATATQ